MSILLKRQGMTQAQRFLPALKPSYYAIEERTLIDHLKYVQAYAKKLRFHDLDSVRLGTNIGKNEKSFWNGFLNFTEQELTEISHLIENPELLEGQPELKQKYFQPHYSLLFTFIKLLAHSKFQVGKFTEQHLDYCYKQSLKIERRVAHVDQTHIIFTIVDYIDQLPMVKGTLLFAGTDLQNQPVEFTVEQDILLNHAQVSDIYTLQLEKTLIGLAQIRDQAGEGLEGFNAMFLHVLGGVKQLPPLPKMLGLLPAITLSQLVNDWYPSVQHLAAEQLSDLDRNYILNQLNFLRISDCQTVFNVLTREISVGAEGIEALEEVDWQNVYRILTQVHHQTHRKTRIKSVQIRHQQKGFNGLIDWLFGVPEPGNMLHSFPTINLTDLTEDQKSKIASYPLAALYYDNSTASNRYVEKHLGLSPGDFILVMSTILGDNPSLSWLPVYRVLEQAWTNKRNYQYPSVSNEKITGLTHKIHYDQAQPEFQSQGIQSFTPFSEQEVIKPVTVNLGLQVQSDLLSMREGIRQFDLVLDCNADSLPLEQITSLQTRYQNSDLFQAYLSNKQGWEQVKQVKTTVGSMITNAPSRDLTGHLVEITAQSKSISLQSNEVLSALAGQYIALDNGHCFEIINVSSNGKVLDLQSVFYRLAASLTDSLVDSLADSVKSSSPQLISGFSLNNESGVLQGDLKYNKQTNTLITTQENFSPEQHGHYIVDAQGYIYQIEQFINASEVQAALLCSVKNTDPSVSKVWKLLTPEFNPQISLDDLNLEQAKIHDPSINFNFIGNTLSIICPQECSAQQLIMQWQLILQKQEQDQIRFDLQLMTDQGDEALPEIEKSLPVEDKWLKRFRTLEHNGIEVSFEGRRNESASLTILPEINAQITDFAIVDHELKILPAMNATANEVAAAWRYWSKNKPTDNFTVVSQDKRLLALESISERSLSQRDLTEKEYLWLDDELNGCRFSYKGPSAQSASVMIKENVTDYYDFEISEENELTVLYPFQRKTLSSTLIKAWEQWRNSVLNDSQGFSILLLGEDILDVVGRSTFELEAVYQVFLSNGDGGENGTDVNTIEIIHYGQLPNNSQVTIIKSDILKTEFGMLDNTLEIILPESQIITAQVLLEHWDDWKIANSGALLNLSFELKGDPEAIVMEQNYIWQLIGGQGVIDEHGLVIDYDKSSHPDIKSEASVIFKEQPQAEESTNSGTLFSFSFQNDEVTDIVVLVIHYPQVRAQRTVEQLLIDWAEYQVANVVFGFTLTESGEASWEVSSDSQFLLLPSKRSFYRLSSASSAYIQLDFETLQTGVPHISMNSFDEPRFNFQFMLTDGVPNLLIQYPIDPDYQTAEALFDAWYMLPDHFGFTLRDSSMLVKKRGEAKLPETGNIIKQIDFNDLRLKYTGPEQEVALSLKYQRPFTQHTEGQQLLLESGLLFEINKKYNKHESRISLIGLIDCTKKAGIYPTNSVKLHSLRFQGEVDESFLPVTAIEDAEQGNSGLAKREKAGLKIVLNPEYGASNEEEPYFLYPLFRSIVVEQVHLRVNVSKIKSALARQQRAAINLQSESTPFGDDVLSGAYFDFSHPELCAKPLEALHCEFNWLQVTDPISLQSNKIPDLQSYYKSYSLLGDKSVADLSNTQLTNSLSLYKNNRWYALGEMQKMLVNSQSYFIEQEQLDYSYTSDEVNVILQNTSSSAWKRYFRLTVHANLWSQAFTRLETKLSQLQQQGIEAESRYLSGVQAKQNYHEIVKATFIAMAEAKQTDQPFQVPAIPAPSKLVDPRDDLQEFSEFELPEPYIPTFKNIEFSYQASSYLDLTDIITTSELSDSDSSSNISFSSNSGISLELYRQHPFGIRQMGSVEDKDDYLLPLYQKAGYLFLGLTRLPPGQSVSLLFKILSGTGESAANPPKANWYYLSKQTTSPEIFSSEEQSNNNSVAENWLKLPESALLKDETKNLQNTGLVQINIPDDASTQHKVMPAGRIWLRVEFDENITTLPTIVNVYSQAVLVKYRLSEAENLGSGSSSETDFTSRLMKPLPAKSISALVEALPGMKAIDQPYASVFGQAIEVQQDYHQRVAERLQHKERCLTASDYETLVLSKFSDLHQVLCLPTKDYMENRSETDQPFDTNSGAFKSDDLKLIIIAKTEQDSQTLSLKPRASVDQLSSVQSMVDQHKPARVNVEVINPDFEELTFRLAVKFKPGFDKGFYSRELNLGIISFLSPWSYGDVPSLDFSHTLYNSSVVRFIESLPFIDYIANFTVLRQVIKHADYTEVMPLFLTEDNAASTRYIGNLLVSSVQHVIDVIENDIFDASAYQGLGYMQIGSDYWVNRPGGDFNFGIGELLIEEPRLYPELLTTENIPETDINGQNIWQELLDKEYVNENYQIGKAFNRDLGLIGFDIDLPDDDKQRLFQLFIARQKWQPSEFRFVLS